MRKERSPSPTESPLLFEVDTQPIEEMLTAFGGILLVVQTFRSLGLPKSVREQVQVRERERGYGEVTLLESLVILNVPGASAWTTLNGCGGPGLAEMVGHELPSPAAALQFLYALHKREKIEEAKQRHLPNENNPASFGLR